MKNDRGIKKFAPFKSLKGQCEILDQIKKEKSKIEKPELENDQIIKIQEMLDFIRKNKFCPALIRCYKNGSIVYFKGPIKKATDIYLIIAAPGDIRLNYGDILDIELLS